MSREEWEEEYRRSPKRRERFVTLSFEEVPPLGLPAEGEPPESVGYPGQYPYTRGIHPTGYRGRPWTIRQFAGFAGVEETNRRFRHLLEQGQHGVSVAFDMPTLLGLDSDHALARGEVGVCGVAVDTADDVVRLFEGIPLGEISVSMTINGPAQVVFAFFLVAAEEQGVDWARVRGTLQNDIFKEYIAQKEWLFPPEPHLRLITDMIAFCARRVPQWNTISVSGYHIREAGATAAQELAFTLGDGFAYVEACRARGMDVDEFAPRLSFFFDAHIDFFEEIAKFRAARRIWARWMRERYGARDERSLKLRFHTQTAGVSLTAQQPDNNVVRTAIEALAAVLGGTQSLHTNALDEVYALPTERAGGDRPAHPAGHRRGDRGGRQHRPPRRVLVRGGDDRPHGAPGRGDPGPRRPPRRRVHARRGAAGHRGGLVPAGAGRLGLRVREGGLVGGAGHRGGEPLRAGGGRGPRDPAHPRSRSRSSSAGASSRAASAATRRRSIGPSTLWSAAARGEANLMEPLVAAARARATEGEIVAALQSVFGAYREPPRV